MKKPQRADLAGAAINIAQEKRRYVLLLMMLAMLLILLSIATFAFVRYLRSPAPLPELLVPQAGLNYPPHYLFSIYGVDQPAGVALSPEGDRIYISESGGDRLIRVFDREGDSLGAFAPPSTAAGERSPVYMATDSQGRLYAADRLQHAIFVFSRSGVYLDSLIDPELSLSEYVSQHLGGQMVGTYFSYNAFQEHVVYQASGHSEQQTLPAPAVFAGWSPLGIRIDERDRVFVTDVVKGANRVWAFTAPAAATMTSWYEENLASSSFGQSGKGAGEFLFPNGAAADSRGRIYVSDGNNGRISIWDGEGSFLGHFGLSSGDGSLSLPRGLFLDHRDRLHVVDTVGQNVLVYDVGGDVPEFLFSFGDFGLDDGEFNYPGDIALDDSGRLYVTDRENNRLQVWSY